MSTHVQDIYVAVFNSFNFYKNVPLRKVLESIKNGSFRKQIHAIRVETDLDKKNNLKQHLPAFTICGSTSGHPTDRSIKTYSNLIGLDIDDAFPNVEESTGIVTAINSCEFTYCSFLSPSGQGIKVFVKSNNTMDDHESAYGQIVDYFIENFKVKLDMKCIDQARLCYVSDDERLYINENSAVFNYKKIEFGNSFNKPVEAFDPKNLQLRFDNMASKIEDFTVFEEGNRNEFVHLLANSCNRQGYKECDATSLISNSKFNFNAREVSTAIKSAYKNTHEHNKYPLLLESDIINQSKQLFIKRSLSLKEIIDRVSKEPKPVKIYDFIKKGSIGVIYGVAKTGKTILCENLGMSIACGRKTFLDQKGDQIPQRVLFISLEEFWANRTERNVTQLKDLTESEKTLVLDNYIVVTEKMPKQFTCKDDWNVLAEEIKLNKPDVVFIDSLTRIVDGQIENSDIAKRL